MFSDFRSTSLCLPVVGLILFGLMGCDDANSDEAVSPTSSFEEQYRPQFHYTPRQNWMNDPNGLVYRGGTYHLFHQYNPEGNTWGHMSWNQVLPSGLYWWKRWYVPSR